MRRRRIRLAFIGLFAKKGTCYRTSLSLQIRPLARGYWRSLLLLDLRRRNDADSKKQGEAGGSVLKYVTDGDNAANDEDAHSGERKYATRRYRAYTDSSAVVSSTTDSASPLFRRLATT